MNTQNFPKNIDHMPEIEEGSSSHCGAIENNVYHCDPKAFPQSQISENKKAEQLLQYLFYYFGSDYLGVPTRNDIVAENDEGLSAILNNALAK